MKFKLDENLSRAAAATLSEDGHDVATVHEQGLCGKPDREVITVCGSEERCLVTMDVEFGNPLLFNPSAFHGIALVRLPPRPSATDAQLAINSLREAIQRELARSKNENPLRGKLWVVQPDRVRVYQQPDTDLS